MGQDWIELENLGAAQVKAIDAVYAGASNAQWELLVLWGVLQMQGVALDAEFENVATALLVAAIAHRRLPGKTGSLKQDNKKNGAVKILADFNQRMALREGESREDVIDKLAAKFHLSEGTIQSRLTRARDTWVTSPDAARAFLKKTFPATGRQAIRTNATILRITRKSTARK
jgi:hypothetical protein